MGLVLRVDAIVRVANGSIQKDDAIVPAHTCNDR